MKLALNLSLFLFVLLILEAKSYSQNYYQIKKICKKEKMISTCIKNLREKKYKLQRGYIIEIPVVPYKR